MGSPLDIELLRSFVSVVETGGISRASGRIGRSQAAVSMQMARLEDIVGKPLLNRTGRGVTTTLQGARLLAHARAILRLHDDALAELSGRSVAGSLRFGCPDDYASAFLPALLSSFAELHPQVAIEVVCASTPRLADRLQRNDLDLALTSVTLDAPTPILRHEALVWVGSQRHPESTRPDPLRLALGDPDTLDHVAALAALKKAGRTHQIAYSSSSLSGLLAVVRSGRAIAVLTRAAVPADLHIIPPGAGLPRLPTIGLALRMDEKTASTVTRVFEAHIRSLLPSL